jgi:hypothetical protein
MKKITFILLLMTTIVQGQNAVASRVNELISQNQRFRPVMILTPSLVAPNEEISKVVDDATIAALDFAGVSDIVANRHEYIEVNIPYNGGLLAVQLFRVDIFAEGFHVDTDKAARVEYNPGVYYRGIIKNQPTSVAALNFFNNEISGVVSAEEGNIVIGKIDRPGNVSEYIVYSDAKMKVLNQFSCGVKDEVEHDHEHDNTFRSPTSTRCVTMYFEVDYDLYLGNGSSVTTTTNWMTGVFNNVQTLFANSGITTSLKSMFIWTTQDPYVGSSSVDYLYQFNAVRPTFDGDVGQLVGIDPGGLGGVAITINGLCSQNNFSYSDVFLSYSTVPTYSWTIQVVTHEFGHLLGSRHTHACVWNGNSTAIDNCGPVGGGTSEGSGCVTNPATIPSNTQKGTIMSYCHLVAGVGISFSNGFGPQPSNVMLNAVNGGTCLSLDCVTTCINTIANINATVTNTTATITWDDPSNQSSWQVAVLPFNSNFPNWITVNSRNYTATGLNPNTYYRVRVRPACPEGLTATFRVKIFATSADWCNGITITDTGGANGNYTDLQDYTRVLIPNVPNKKIRLTFTVFSLERDYDYVYIHDGNSTSAPELTGGLTGSTIPGPFVSSSPDGALTLRFFSDPGVVDAGYVATVSCLDNLSSAGFSGVDFTYYPNPSTGLVNIIAKSDITQVLVYNPQGRLLYQGKPASLETKVDVSSFATGTYFFKVFFGEVQANFTIMTQ